MNIVAINLKDIGKYFIKVFAIIFIIYIWTKYLLPSNRSITKFIGNKIDDRILTKCINITIPVFNSSDEKTNKKTITSLMNLEVAMLNVERNVNVESKNSVETKTEEVIIEENKTTISPNVTIANVANTEYVSDRNFVGSYTDIYNTTKIDNQCDYELTEEMLTPDAEITDKKNVLIYHTHTCESYTPDETYNYEMTGNYRTTDSNYNVVRVGRELDKYLTEKGFKVVHNETYHDYPAYSGSYARSLETAQNLLDGQEAEIVIDLHRDAMGNGDTYGPTIMVDGQRVAQLMFVLGTDGGGLDHPNWVQNLKIAVKIQETANQMYPGLFRPMIIRNSRYNQHLAKGASIIEVGATANNLGECLLSMQCLANVLEEVCK